MDYIKDIQEEYHHSEYLLEEIRTTDILLRKNTENIIRHILGGMNIKANFFTVFGKKKSPCCWGQSISIPNTYCIYIFMKNIWQFVIAIFHGNWLRQNIRNMTW